MKILSPSQLLANTHHDDNTDTILTLPLFSETQNPPTFSLDSKIVEMDNFWEDHWVPGFQSQQQEKLKDFIGKRSRYFENDGKRSHYFDTARPGGAGFKGATPPQTKLLYISGVKFQG